MSDDYTRNKIRHKVVPLLREINPALFGAISRLSQSVSDDDKYLDKIAAQLMEYESGRKLWRDHKGKTGKNKSVPV